MKRPENPCYGCDARIEGCHAFCERYTRFAKDNEEYRNFIHEERRKDFVPGRPYTPTERKRKKIGGQR